MRSLITRAILISFALFTLLFPAVASASIPESSAQNTSLTSPLPERVFAIPGCAAHRKAYQDIYIEMDFNDARSIITGLADPKKDVIQASAEDADHSNITIIWTWRNERMDGILIEEVSQLTVRTIQYKVVAITFDYSWRSLETVHEESRSKASRSFVERKPDPKPEPEKK